MAGEVQLNSVTALTESSGGIVLNNVDSATNRTNLGLAIGSDVQANDAGLTSISGLTTAADKMIYTTGSDTYAVSDLTAAGRALLDDASASDQRTTLGLAIGSDVQAFDSDTTKNDVENSFVAKQTITSSEIGAVLSVNNDATATSGVNCIETSLAGSNQNNTNCFHLKATTQSVASYGLRGNGSSTFTSDARQKKNITTAPNMLAKINDLRVVEFNWIVDDDAKDKQIGLIAQEVELIFPELVGEDFLDGVGVRKNLNFSAIPYLLLKALQEQQTQIDALTARIAALETT